MALWRFFIKSLCSETVKLDGDEGERRVFEASWATVTSRHLIDSAVYLFAPDSYSRAAFVGHVFCPGKKKKNPSCKPGLDEHAPATAVELKALTPRAALLFRRRTKRFSRKEQLLPAPLVLLSWPSFVCWFQGRFCPRLFPRWARRTGRTQRRSRPLPSAIMAVIQSWQGSVLPRHTERGNEPPSSSLALR